MKLLFLVTFVFVTHLSEGCYIPPEVFIQLAEMTQNFLQRLKDIKDEVEKAIADKENPPEEPTPPEDDAAPPAEGDPAPPEDGANPPEQAPPADPFAPFAPFVEVARKVAEPFVEAAAAVFG